MTGRGSVAGVAALVAALPPDVPFAQADTCRIIAAEVEPAALFEELVPGADVEALLAVLALTAPETLHRIGTIALVPMEDRAYGPGAGWAMTAFAHPARPSRFTDGRYGLWYAAGDLDTAIAETAFHHTRRLRETAEPRQAVALQVLTADLAGVGTDLRSPADATLDAAVHDPMSYTSSQAIGRVLRDRGSDAAVYRSVRRPGGVCAAVFRPRIIRRAHRTAWATYDWDGTILRPRAPVPA